MKKAPLFYFIVFTAFILLSSCSNNSDKAKKKIIDAITAACKQESKNVYQKLDSVHIISYDSLTEKKYLNFIYSRNVYQKGLNDSNISFLSSKINVIWPYRKALNQEDRDGLNNLIALYQTCTDSSHVVGDRMQKIAAQCQVADSTHYYGFIAKITLYITTAEVTSAPYNEIAIIDKNDKVSTMTELPPIKHLLDSIYHDSGLPSGS